MERRLDVDGREPVGVARVSQQLLDVRHDVRDGLGDGIETAHVDTDT